MLSTIARSGGVAEWLKAPVLKTGDPQGSASSNLAPSAFEIVGLRWQPFRPAAAIDVVCKRIANVPLPSCPVSLGRPVACRSALEWHSFSALRHLTPATRNYRQVRQLTGRAHGAFGELSATEPGENPESRSRRRVATVMVDDARRSGMARVTRTTNKLHFTDLDHARFEDLSVNLLYGSRTWEELQHHGRAGADGGTDVYGVELAAGVRRRWIAQCRRYGRASAATLKNAVDDALDGQPTVPDVLLVVVACDVSRSASDAFKKYATEKGVAMPLVWSASILEAMLYADRPDLLFSYFGVSQVGDLRRAEAATRRNVRLRKRMRRELGALKMQLHESNRVPGRGLWGLRAIVHSIDDTTYPKPDETSSIGPSGWFGVELYGFYHNGIEVLLGGSYAGAIFAQNGRWRLVDDDARVSSGETPVTVLPLGRIPFRNIIAFDTEGDEYYNRTHLYCAYADAGMPYEGYRYVTKDKFGDVELEADRRVGAAPRERKIRQVRRRTIRTRRAPRRKRR
jgi:hypothetical protein